jgi:hypothetical protein
MMAALSCASRRDQVRTDPREHAAVRLHDFLTLLDAFQYPVPSGDRR